MASETIPLALARGGRESASAAISLSHSSLNHSAIGACLLFTGRGRRPIPAKRSSDGSTPVRSRATSYSSNGYTWSDTSVGSPNQWRDVGSTWVAWASSASRVTGT